MNKQTKIITYSIMSIMILIIFTTKWLELSYNNASFEQILFHMTEPITGVSKEIIINFIFCCIIVSLIESIIAIYILNTILKFIKQQKYIKIINYIIYISSIIVFLSCLNDIGLFEYIKNGNSESTFIEDNYVNPKTAKIIFPDNKKNLIYIYVESLESTYLSKEYGGSQKTNLMPELYELANNNISFSDKEEFGGAIQIHGTSWTSAAMIAHTAGIPLKMPEIITNNSNLSTFLNGAYSLGEILEKEGYNQTIMFGSNGNFGNRKLYFQTHGNYNVYDYYSAIKQKKIPSDYKVWWGYEDSKLFDYAKEEIIKLSEDEQPFNFTMLTSNTHYPDGYLEASCEKKHKNKYANVISCTSYQLNDFIKWCQEQTFYENTTIIITGDHLSMDPKFFRNIEDKDRRIFNIFINSSIKSSNTKNRQFSTLDMYPTTLASLGVTIEGNKLALGTNLFSDEPTIIERFGLEVVNKEFANKSTFYNNTIIGHKN